MYSHFQNTETGLSGGRREDAIHNQDKRPERVRGLTRLYKQTSLEALVLELPVYCAESAGRVVFLGSYWHSCVGLQLSSQFQQPRLSELFLCPLVSILSRMNRHLLKYFILTKRNGYKSVNSNRLKKMGKKNKWFPTLCPLVYSNKMIWKWYSN